MPYNPRIQADIKQIHDFVTTADANMIPLSEVNLKNTFPSITVTPFILPDISASKPACQLLIPFNKDRLFFMVFAKQPVPIPLPNILAGFLSFGISPVELDQNRLASNSPFLGIPLYYTPNSSFQPANGPIVSYFNYMSIVDDIWFNKGLPTLGTQIIAYEGTLEIQ